MKRKAAEWQEYNNAVREEIKPREVDEEDAYAKQITKHKKKRVEKQEWKVEAKK
jgi:hypothetical protein